MKTSKTKVIIGLVLLLAIAGAGYKGYELYGDKIDKILDSIKPTNKSSKDKKTQDEEPNFAGEDSQIDWANMLKSLQNDEDGKTTDKTAKQESKATKDSTKSTQTSTPAKKPYLAIIMDDMAYPSQLKDLENLDLKITPSFFPVSKDSPQTAKMAKKVPFYMVHLPLEAKSNQKAKFDWISTGDSLESIQNKIAKIKKDFPSLTFINNHTGSQFSESYDDMLKLLYVLSSYGIDFVDSRTTQNTKADIIYKRSARPLLYRDVFLDNEQNQAYIQNQLKQAIEVAKKKGYAIAICHPHQATFKALKSARNMLLREVELVYIKDLPMTKNRPSLNISLKDLESKTAKTQTKSQNLTNKNEQNKTQATPQAQIAKQPQQPQYQEPIKIEAKIDQSLFTESKALAENLDGEDCDQSELEAFISNYPTDRQKIQKSSLDPSNQNQKPKDYLER